MTDQVDVGLAGSATSADEFRELKDVLIGPERARLEALERRLDASALNAENLAGHLPEAIALRAGRDQKLGRALAPTVQSAIAESVRRNPREIATAIFPVLGPAIRKAIAEAMAGLVASINAAVDHSLSPRGIRWRIESWRTGVPYPQIVLKHALVYRVEQVFLIHSETGLLLCHAAAPDLKVANADLVSGMMTAIQDFVADSFKGEEDGGRLRTFSVGELSVIVESGPQAVLAAVVRGVAPDTLLTRLQGTLESLHYQLASQLAGFTGDSEPFAAARQPLEECLETVLSTDRTQAKPGGRPWLGWAIPLALVVVGAGWWLVSSADRWRSIVRRLDQEPGVVVVDAKRSWGRWSFSGLRDPLAVDPTELLTRLGVDTRRVEARWDPYLSLEPAMVVARVTRATRAPTTVKFTVVGDSLVASGQAPVRWLWGAQRLAPPAGSVSVDYAAVAPVLAVEAAALRLSLEDRRVAFDVGSGVLSDAGRVAIGEIASLFGRIRREAPEGAIGLDIVGRADPSGSDTTNQALSRLRAGAVQARLMALGVPGAVIRSAGIGVAEPLPDPDPAVRARLNRSVSFRVVLLPSWVQPQ